MNQILTVRAPAAHDGTVAAHQRCEIGVSESRRTSRQHSGFFNVRQHGPQLWATVRGIFGCAGPLTRYANPHGLPSSIGVEEGGITTRSQGAITMPHVPGVDARQQSSTLQSLDRFTPDGITALAVVGMVLAEAVNDARLTINDSLPAGEHASTRSLIDRMYDLQDALHGDSDALPAALAGFVAAAESGVCRG